MTNAYQLIPISDSLEQYADTLAASSSLHRSLRLNLPSDYIAYMRQMFSEGAEMVALTAENEVKSLAVYRCHHTTFHGFRFYIDDLVTVETGRGKGFGQKVLSWCDGRARERGCDTFDLESGVQRPRTHQLYLREGLTIFAFSFTKPLR